MQVHKESKSLILKLRNPARVTQHIPRARVVHHEGVDYTQVRFGLDEAKVLRNLGINAPSPVRYFYDWPIYFPGNPQARPFDHQVTTAEFFTLNNRAICLNDMGCVDASTEYLSPTGWRRMDEYDGGMVAQYEPETGNVSFVPPSQYVKKPCTEMIRLKTSRGVDQLLSPEHRVLYVASTGRRMVTSAEQVESAYHRRKLGWSGRFITTFSADPTLAGVALTDPQLRLQVAVIADGHFPNGTNRAVIRVKKQRKIDRLMRLLHEAKVPAKWKFEAATGFAIVTFQAPLRVKEFDARFWCATQAQLQLIASEVAHWDGSHLPSGAREFFSNSKASADFVQYAFAACGFTATVGMSARDGRNDTYFVHARSKAAQLYLKGENAGVKATNVWREPSPDGFKYCFMVPSTFLLLRRNGCIFATGNTGKSLSAMWAADYLMRHGIVRKALVVCPRSTMNSVWKDEIEQHMLGRRKVAVLSGDAARRRKLLDLDVDFYVINHDGLKVVRKELAGRTDINLWIVDEADAFRNAETDRHKTLATLVRGTDWLWLMTGTPCPQSPLDAWGLAKLLGSKRLPKYFTTFRNETMLQLSQYKWVPKPDAYDRVYDVLQPGIRFQKKDCLKDLPPVLFETRTCDLSAEQSKAFKTMLNDLIAEVKSGTVVTAANAGVKLQKLVQIACGFVYDEFGNPFYLNPEDRLSVCEELVAGANGKAIVFVPFKAGLELVANHLRKRWKVAVVSGETGDTERAQIFRDFQKGDDLQVLVAHPATTSHGLTLTRADTTVWYAPVTSLGTFEQANNRMDRPGQKNSMLVAMIAANSIEQQMYAALKGKQDVQNNILALYKSALGLPT